MGKKVLIVGGVAGGASAAARLRRMDENVEIILFERGEYISFANCGLPYYIGGSIKERDALLLQTPEAMKSRFNIDVRVQNEVVKIDKENKKVVIKDLKSNNTYEETYDDLILSPGSSPIKPRIEGIDSPNVFSLWNIPDTDKIKNFIDTNKPKRAVVVGGGFIGIEMVENLRDQGLEVSLVEAANQIMTSVDFEMAQILHQHIKSHGVNLYLDNGVKSFEYKNSVTKVHLQNGSFVEADMVIVSIGVRPNGELAKEASLTTNKRGGIVVDSELRTSDKNIYAVGDAIQVKDFISDEDTMIPLAGPANKQGRMVANNICGLNEKYKGTQGTAVAKVFDLTVASTGNSEKTLERQGKKYDQDYKIAFVQPKSHAGYYPGAIPMTIKLIFALDGKILGAQIVGYDGVDKRIDVIATSIRFKGTIYDLEELELAYAPPFSSAKDPVNMAGFVAENILNKKMDAVLWREIKDLDIEKNIIVDVRTKDERELGYIDGAISIPVNDIRERLGELDKSKTIIVYCAIGLRAYIATRILVQNGFKVRNLLGGYSLYKIATGDYKGSDDMKSNSMKISEKVKNEKISEVIKLDACGLQCPGPLMKVSTKVKEIKDGEVLEIKATDPGFPADMKAWCDKTNNTFIKTEKLKDGFAVWLRKGNDNKGEIEEDCCSKKSGSSMVVFSGDLDKAIASFIIANGSASMGKQVTMFFTFWGLNILRKPDKVQVKKSAMDQMFGSMMPKGTSKLGISKMNMGGMGAQMIRKVMKDKNVDSLDALIDMAIKQGVKLVACTMSMDVMGLKQEELIDGVEFAGVGAYLGAAEDSNLNLFI